MSGEPEDPARADIGSSESNRHWNPMQEYLIGANQMPQDNKNDKVENKDKANEVSDTGSKKDDSKKDDLDQTIKTEDSNTNPPDDQTEEKVFGMSSRSKTIDLPSAPDPLRDNYTSDKTKTHIVEEPKSVHVNQPTPEKDPSLGNVTSSFLGRIDKIEDDNQHLLDDNKRLIDSLRRMDDGSVQINERMKTAEDNYQKTMTENNLLKSNNIDLSSQIQNLKTENDRLRKAAHDSNILLKVQLKEFEADKDQLEQKLEDAYSMIKSLESQVETLNEINEQLEKKVSGLENKTSATTTGLEDTISSLEGQIQQLKATNTQLKVDMDETEQENDNLLQNVEKLREENKQLIAGKSEQESSADDIQNTLRSKEELCETLEQETLSLTEQVGKYQSQSDHLQDVISSLEDKLKEQEVEIKLVEEERDLLEDKLIKKDSETCSKCENLQMEILRLERKNADQKEWLDTIRLSGASLSEFSKQKQQYIGELQSEVVNLRIRNSTLQNEVGKLKGENSTRDIANIQLEEIKASYKRVMEENRRLKEIQTQQSMEETNKKSEKENLEANYEEMKEKLVKATVRIKRLEKLIDEIYENEEFQHFLHVDESSHLQTLSLPDISISNTPRYVNSRKSGYVTTTPRTDRSNKVSTYRIEDNKLVRKRKR